MKIEWDIVKRFSQSDTPCFSTEDVRKEFTQVSVSHLRNILMSMVKNNMLVRLTKGLYYIVPLEHNNPNFIPNWHLVAKYLMRNKNYYIGYYSAMQIHKLITQPSLTEIVVTDIQIKPSKIEIQGVRFQFVYHNKNRFFGVKNTWIDDFNKVKCSDLEKTIVDSFINPHYSGGIIEIAKAVHETRDKVDLSKLFNYFTSAGSKVAARRYVFICDLLEISSSYHESLLQNHDELLKLNQTGSFQRLDTSAPDEGKINTRYGLKVNRDIDTIKEAMYT
ncbi:MAG: transcriptional regulator [Flavobacteriales bacterium]|nr:MAG: transcriptional regulator [Flavobacteriales bacterium]